MNKKGSLLHWTLFGFLIALGMVLVLSPINLQAKEKGSWQLTFLEENYLEAEKELLKTSIIARKTGLEIAQELAEKGGYLEESSACGELNSLPLWNKKEQPCFPAVNEAVSRLAAERMKAGLGRTFTGIGFEENLFFGRGEERTVVSQAGTYYFRDNFAVDLGYSFEEYEKLESEARELIQKCRPANDLPSCLSALPERWHLGDCGNSPAVSAVSGRQALFCVGSAAGTKSKIKYQFALDFAGS